ncbi:MAG: GIY-YIG nuclease family protein, partial [Erysipelotrichaceae bacterium]|nr:GIY-YIG nuclease family protein [Erysipelotrichaceae bacterium]
MLKNKLLTLPMEPGCYLMKDKHGEVIYVGKAKKLKNRVSQYFVGTHDNKTTKMVSNVVDFDYIVAPSEKEALILEYNLIKQYKPRFNIMFMDDASYPYIRLTLEDYPTPKVVRDAKRLKNAKYFGPYP